MKFLKTAIVLACIASSSAYAEWKWIDGDPWGGTGIGVELVYPQFQTKQLIFKGSNGIFYYYPWDSNSNYISDNAQTIMSILLTALASGKNVNVYHDPAQTSGNYIRFQFVNVRK